jgi:heptosyltransferase III
MVKDAINLNDIKRVLVTKLRHHGDVLLTSPVLQVLNNHAPHLQIDALVYADTREMLEGHPALHTLHTIDRAWKSQGIFTQGKAEMALLRALRAREFDLVLHLTEHRRGMWLTKLLRPTYSVAGKREDAAWNRCFTHTYPSPRNSVRHTVELNLDALRRIGIYPTEAEKPLVLVPGTVATEKVATLMQQHGLRTKQFIHIHPTSRWFFKTWPVENVVALILELGRAGQQVVLTAAPTANEREMIAAIKKQLKAPIVDLTGALNLKELAALTAQARAFVGVDSAPMHMAAAMQTPTVALFGPSGEQQWGPWGVRNRVVTSLAPQHRCRPCGNDGCGGGKVSECLTQLPVSPVLAALNELLAGQ